MAGATAIQPWNLPALAPGVHVIFATAQDNQGHTTTTPAVRFIVNPNGATPPTAVALTAPTDGASFVSPETIAFAAYATPASGRTIASISYYTNAILQALGGTSPFGASWFNPEPGSYSLRAVATDNAGGMAFSPPITVSVGPAAAADGGDHHARERGHVHGPGHGGDHRECHGGGGRDHHAGGVPAGHDGGGHGHREPLHLQLDQRGRRQLLALRPAPPTAARRRRPPAR